MMKNEIMSAAGRLFDKGFDISFYFYRAKDFLAYAEGITKVSRVYTRVSPEILPLKDKVRVRDLIQIAPYINKNPNPCIEVGFTGKTITNIGDFACLPKYGSLCGDMSLNVFNASTAAFYSGLGDISSLTLSPELSLDELLSLSSEMGKTCPARPEIVVYGRVPVMRCEHCVVAGAGTPVSVGMMSKAQTVPAAAKQGVRRIVKKTEPGPAFPFKNPSFKCGNCASGGTFYLQNEQGMEFPVLTFPDTCTCAVLSARVLNYTEELLKAADTIQGKKPILRFNIFSEE